MSLHPKKKSDMGKEWMQKRLDRSKKLQPEYHLIITEGKKTEPEYFNAIKQKITSNFSERIQVEIHGKGKNTLSLFNYAKRYAESDPNDYRHVWLVYDKDDFPDENFNKTAEFCASNSSNERQYHAIWSNQCVELWFLLHFVLMESDITRNDYCLKLSQQLNKLSKCSYSKNRKDMFNILEPYMGTAIKNAKKLDEEKCNLSPASASPCTMIYKMIEKLLPYIN